MKVIDLLNKIANGEEVPKKIKKNWIYVWTYDDIRKEHCYISKDDDERFDENWLIINMLNEEVEIIEEEKKIPEKLDISGGISVVNCAYKINEIIDCLKSKGDE